MRFSPVAVVALQPRSRIANENGLKTYYRLLEEEQKRMQRKHDVLQGAWPVSFVVTMEMEIGTLERVTGERALNGAKHTNLRACI